MCCWAAFENAPTKYISTRHIRYSGGMGGPDMHTDQFQAYFSGVSANYARFRPAYPAGLFELIARSARAHIRRGIAPPDQVKPPSVSARTFERSSRPTQVLS